MSKETTQYKTIRYVVFDYSEIDRHQGIATLNIIQSFSHIPRVHKANLTSVPQLYNDAIKFSGRGRGPEIYQDCIIVKDAS